MAYAYWKGDRHNSPCVFDMFFRTNPFKGEFTIFAGLEEVIKFLQVYRFTTDQISYLKSLLPHAEAGFWAYLSALDMSELRLYAIAEGTVVFPREPLLRIEGPLALVQLLETTLLNLCNFASLITTNAARHRLAAGPDKRLLEFGLRRAQGSDGAMSASHYAYLGGFDGTSNVAAGHLFGMQVSGTQAHSMVCAYTGFQDLISPMIGSVDMVQASLHYKRQLGFNDTNVGEMAAFIAFAQAFPNGFLALVDTYDTLTSGVPNFICVALALRDAGHTALGVRLDSGDLAFLSRETRAMLKCVRGGPTARAPLGTPLFPNISSPPPPLSPPVTRQADASQSNKSSLAECRIVASNDLNETILLSLQKQGHEIDAFGIGTNLVTCQAQPALGMVYKLVEIGGEPRIKVSQESAKITIPCAKEVYRLLGSEGIPLLDIMLRSGEKRPSPGERILARHPFDAQKRVYVTPTHVIPMLRLVWLGSKAGVPADLNDADMAAVKQATSAVAGAPRLYHLRARSPSLADMRKFTALQIKLVREDHLRTVNPTPYKVSLSAELYEYMHDMLLGEIPIAELT